MINPHTWRPGPVLNCECKITIEQEHNEAGVLVGETFVSAQKCPAHQNIPDGEILGKLKNDVDAEVKLLGTIVRTLDAMDDLKQEVTDEQGNKVREFKPGKGYQILFMGTYPRKVHVTPFGHILTTEQKKAIKDAVKARLGNGKENLVMYE